MREQADKFKFVQTKKFEKCLFTLVENQIKISFVLAKEKINLQEAIIAFDDSNTASAAAVANDKSKYRFKVVVPKGKKSLQEGGQGVELILGCSTEEQRREWMSILQILQKCQGAFNMRKSAAMTEAMQRVQE